MLPTVGFLLAALICGGLAAALVVLVREIRGVPVRPRRARRRVAPAGASARWAAGVLVGLVVLVTTRWPVAAVAGGTMVVFWPKLFGGKRAEQRRIDRLAALVAVIESLRDTVAAGASLEQAIPAAAESAPDLLRPTLTRLVGQMRARVPLDTALADVAVELDDTSADLVVGALILNARRRGDRLSDVLSSLARSARAELDMRRTVAGGREETRRGFQIIVAITLGIAAFLILFGGDYTAAYSTTVGQVALLLVAGVFAAGFAWMRALSQPPPTIPVLARPGQVTDVDEAALLAAVQAQAAAS